MTSVQELVDDEPQSTVPTYVSINPREKIEGEEIFINEIALNEKKKIIPRAPLVWTPSPVPLPGPKPKYPLALIWTPQQLYFEIDQKPIVRKLWIWNGSTHSIYIHCCGLWNDTVRLGAGWRCYPRTRFLLAAGIMAELFVRATPRSHPPVPCACSALQLATAHMRDLVIGYFAIPLQVTFNNYVPPSMNECE